MGRVVDYMCQWRKRERLGAIEEKWGGFQICWCYNSRTNAEKRFAAKTALTRLIRTGGADHSKRGVVLEKANQFLLRFVDASVLV